MLTSIALVPWFSVLVMALVAGLITCKISCPLTTTQTEPLTGLTAIPHGKAGEIDITAGGAGHRPAAALTAAGRRSFRHHLFF